MEANYSWWCGWVIVYLECTNNNRTETVVELFQSATRLYGVQSRVRADRGAENTAVARYMVLQRGSERGSFISGRSVHNHCIERMWRDVFNGCTVLYLRRPSAMKYICIAFIIIFIPRINKSLSEFSHGTVILSLLLKILHHTNCG